MSLRCLLPLTLSEFSKKAEIVSNVGDWIAPSRRNLKSETNPKPGYQMAETFFDLAIWDLWFGVWCGWIEARFCYNGEVLGVN
jgi:hypothetical protein